MQTTQTETNVPRMVEKAVNAGASGAFVAYLVTDHPDGGRHLGRINVGRSIEIGWSLDPSMFGHFMAHLWNGDVEKAKRRTDITNMRIMEEAGL